MERQTAPQDKQCRLAQQKEERAEPRQQLRREQQRLYRAGRTPDQKARSQQLAKESQRRYVARKAALNQQRNLEQHGPVPKESEIAHTISKLPPETVPLNQEESNALSIVRKLRSSSTINCSRSYNKTVVKPTIVSEFLPAASRGIILPGNVISIPLEGANSYFTSPTLTSSSNANHVEREKLGYEETGAISTPEEVDSVKQQKEKTSSSESAVPPVEATKVPLVEATKEAKKELLSKQNTENTPSVGFDVGLKFSSYDTLFSYIQRQEKKHCARFHMFVDNLLKQGAPASLDCFKKKCCGEFLGRYRHYQLIVSCDHGWSMVNFSEGERKRYLLHRQKRIASPQSGSKGERKRYLLHRQKRIASRQPGSKEICPDSNSHFDKPLQVCPFQVHLVISKDCRHLVVQSGFQQHDHKLMPRSSTPLNKTKCIEEKKLHLSSTTDCLDKKFQVKRDNKEERTTLMKCNGKHQRCSLDMIVTMLTSVPGGRVQLNASNSDVLQSVCFQDDVMKDMFNCYPEVLVVETIVNPKDPQTHLYLFLILDGNGECEIVAACLTVAQGAEAMSDMCRFIKQSDANWAKVEVISAGQDCAERVVLQKEFPSAVVQIHTADVMGCFRKAIPLQIPPEKRLVLELFVYSMAHSSCAEEFKEWYNRLKAACPRSVLKCHREMWRAVASQYVDGFKQQRVCLVERANKQVVPIHKEVLVAVFAQNDLKEVVSALLQVLHSLRFQADNRVIETLKKVKPAFELHSEDDELKFQQFVTPYAFQYLQFELRLAAKADISQLLGSVFYYKSKGSNCVVTQTTCSCSFYKAMALPCRHIFSVRLKSNTSLFDKELVHQRWRLVNYLSHCRPFSKKHNNHLSTAALDFLSMKHTHRESDKPSTESSITLEKHSRDSSVTSDTYADCGESRSDVLSSGDSSDLLQSRLKRISQLCKHLASLASEECAEGFEERYNLLSAVSGHWERGENVLVLPVADDTRTTVDIVMVPTDTNVSNKACDIRNTPAKLACKS